MSVANGNPANANTFNTSFVSREEDSDTVGVLGLNNTTDPNSGDEIINAQRLINEVADSDGTDGEGDATRKIYGSENVVADGDSRKSAIGKLDERFDGTTGHSHDGTDGNGRAISAASISDFNNFFAEYQELTFDSANGLTTDVSADFAAKTPGGTSSSVGVLTTAPGNRVEIVGKDDYREIEDVSGNRVYARLEKSTSWTLTYYVNIAGVETAHNLSSQNIRYLYREVFTAATRRTISPSVGLYDSLSAVEDIPAASQTVEGKVTIAAQSFGGVKNFIDGLQKNGVDAATVSDAQTIINKILDGGVATNTRYWNVPAETTANLTALTRKAGAIYYSNSENSYYGDDGANLISLGGASALGDLTDVTITSPVSSDVLSYNGSAWVNQSIGTVLSGPTIQVTYEVASGGNGGSGTVGSYGAIVYNVLTGGFGSLAAGVLTLPAGTYNVFGEQFFFRGDRCKFRMYNITAASVVARGQNVFADNAANRSSVLGTFSASFTIGAPNDFQFEERVTVNGSPGLTLGIGASFGEPEIFGTVTITKVS